MTPSAILSAAADLIERPGAWTQGAEARNAQGAGVEPREAEAVCWCAVGALAAVSIDRFVIVDHPAIKALREVIDERCVTDWNDRRYRTQAEVVDALRKAAAL